jgi:hypothetical protein
VKSRSLALAYATWVFAMLVCASAAVSRQHVPQRYVSPSAVDTAHAYRPSPWIPAQSLATDSLLFEGLVRGTLIFNSQDHVVGKVPVGTGESRLDQEGNYYQADPVNPPRLLIFAPPYDRVSTRITFSVNVNWGVAVDPKTGVFAVALQSGNKGYVEFFRHGSQVPCATVSEPEGSILATGLVFDAEGRLFVLDEEVSNETVASIAGECQAKSVVVYHFPTQINPLPPLTFTSNDRLVFQDGVTETIQTYELPQNNQFGAPIATTRLVPTGSKPMLLECLTNDGGHLWASELPPGSQQPLAEYQYPSGGKPVAFIHVANPGGCAVFPPIVPVSP